MKQQKRYSGWLRGMLLLLILTLGDSAYAQGTGATLNLAAPTPTAPKIDGKLDDPCWQQAAQSTGFSLNTRHEAAGEQTTVYVAYDQRCLYVAFECLESQMEKLAASVSARDGQIFKDDVVELFLDPNQDRFTYYQFAVNPLGTRFDLRGDAAGVNPQWDVPWDAAATRGEDRWTAEMAIPFSSIDINPEKVGSTWGINFAREEKPHQELSSWSFTGGGFAQPARFGKLTGLQVDFSRYAYAITVADPGARLIGNNVLKARVTGPRAELTRVSMELYLTDGTAQRKEVNLELKPADPALVLLPYSLPREGVYRMVLRVRSIADGETLHAAGVSLTVPPLLEVSLYPNYYRQELCVRPRLNMRDEERKNYRLSACLLKEGAPLSPTREVAAITVKEPILPFDLSRLRSGEYAVAVTLSPKSAGAPAARQVLRFTHTARPAQASPAVTVSGDNTLLVSGRRFFPLGIYRYGRFSDRSLRELRDCGFNLIQVMLGGGATETRAMLDRVQAYGMKAWIPLSHKLALPAAGGEQAAQLKKDVVSLATHPALLCWESVDEPAWGDSDADALYRGYSLLRRVDPNHPLWTNHAPRNTIDELARFNRATDIAGADIYPVPTPQTQSDLPNKTISVVGDETRKNVLAVLNRKPIFMVLQGFAWADLSRRQGQADQAIYPTFAQSRFMAYQSVVRGARGLLYWGANYMPRPSPCWNDLRRLVYELSQMRDVLAGPDAGDQVQVLSGGKAIETLVRRHSATGERFLIAVNSSAQPVTARLQVPRAGSKVPWRVLFEKRKVTGNPIVDHFKPYEVHIYTASTSFPPERFLQLPPITAADYPRPEDLTQPGNLLINPGFEYVPDVDDMPTGWNLQPPFGGGITQSGSRSGKYCVYVRGSEEDAKPLWVQSGIATAPGRRYRLQAQVRTQPAGIPYRLYAEWTDGAKYLGGYVPAKWSAGPADWQEAAIDFTVDNPKANQMYVVLQLQGKGQAWFDDVRLEER